MSRLEEIKEKDWTNLEDSDLEWLVDELESAVRLMRKAIGYGGRIDNELQDWVDEVTDGEPKE